MKSFTAKDYIAMAEHELLLGPLVETHDEFNAEAASAHALVAIAMSLDLIANR